MNLSLQHRVAPLVPCARAIHLIVALGADRLAARAGIPIEDARAIVAHAQEDLGLLVSAVAGAKRS